MFLTSSDVIVERNSFSSSSSLCRVTLSMILTFNIKNAPPLLVVLFYPTIPFLIIVGSDKALKKIAPYEGANHGMIQKEANFI